MSAQLDAVCKVATGYEEGTRMFARIQPIRSVLGLGIAATMLVTVGSGQPASAHPTLPTQTVITHELTGAALGGETAPVDYVVLPATGEPETTLASGAVVTTLPSTGVGPSDPDKRTSHWLFVIGGTMLGFGHLELARRKLSNLAAARTERDH